MELPAQLVGQLQSLTAALDDADPDLEALLAALGDSLGDAVSSFLGLRLTIVVEGNAVTLSTLDERAPGAQASVRFPLSRITGAATGSTAAFFAGTAGAFVDFAVDLRRATGLDGEVVLDHDLPGEDDPVEATLTGLQELIVVNRALGVLMGHGFTLQDAEAELRARAERSGSSLSETAHAVVDSSLRE